MPVKEEMTRILTEALDPVELEIRDVSHLHEGHAGLEGANANETHFHVKIVSKSFSGKTKTECHRIVYGLLSDLLKTSVHALSLKLSTP